MICYESLPRGSAFEGALYSKDGKSPWFTPVEWVFKDKKFAKQLRRDRAFQSEETACPNELRWCPCSQEVVRYAPQWEGRVNLERGARPEIWGGMQSVSSWRPGCYSSLGIQGSQRSEQTQLIARVDRKLITDDCTEFRKSAPKAWDGFRLAGAHPVLLWESFHAHLLSPSLITGTCNPSLKKGWTCCASTVSNQIAGTKPFYRNSRATTENQKTKNNNMWAPWPKSE